MIIDPWKKENGAMRIGVFVFICALALTSCAHLEFDKPIHALKQVRPGDTQADVFKTVGPPDLRTDISDQRFVAYYQTKPGKSPDIPLDKALCTPVAFENGQVVSVGDDLSEVWTKEEEARLREAEIAQRRRQQAQQARAAREQAEATRLKKIAALEKEVKPIPAANAALNLKLYRQLLDLDPDNARYQQKVATYEERLLRQEQIRQERAMRAAKQKQRQAWEQGREARNKKLRQYTGNGIAEMAVHDMGNGSLYVWVKNVSNQIITTHPDHFTLVDSDDSAARCEISDSLDSVLEPGGLSHGKIIYNKDIQPKELVFQNGESGKISKLFQ